MCNHHIPFPKKKKKKQIIFPSVGTQASAKQVLSHLAIGSGPKVAVVLTVLTVLTIPIGVDFCFVLFCIFKVSLYRPG